MKTVRNLFAAAALVALAACASDVTGPEAPARSGARASRGVAAPVPPAIPAPESESEGTVTTTSFFNDTGLMGSGGGR